MIGQMTVANGPIRLRPIVADDIIHIHQGLSHPDVIKHYAVSFPTLEATQEQMDWYASLERDGTGQWWSMRNQRDDAFLGAIGINNIEQPHRRCELGFWLLPQHWRKGIIRQALPQVLDHAFNGRGLHRIMAEVETDNVASARVLLQAGFLHEGTLRQCEWKNGVPISLDIFAKLSKE